MNEYYDLLKSWCDKLVEYQITELSDPNFHGGILCPACSLIHGRIGDSVYPLTAMYHYSGDEKYLNAAKLAVDWSEYNVLRKNGGYFNDKTHNWMGISVFSTLSFGETLLYHSGCLDDATKEKWTAIFVRLSEFVCSFFGGGADSAHKTNVNYHASTAAALALAYKLTGNEKYKEEACKCAEYSKTFFTDEGLLFGESKGFDIGYNVEESLPALVLFAHYVEDEEYLDFVADKFKTHLEFMIPDGGWDNSWGSRANKWTYWGSRTSDGCQVALSILAKKDPIFAEAAQRSFNMYKKCSTNGLLYGGYMYIEAGEEGCTHHSFCHAKALCAMIDNGFIYDTPTALPRDEEYGLKSFPCAHVELISKGDFRATVSASDVVSYSGAATTGGTMTLLWNKKVGPIFAASMADYQMAEPKNMQYSRHINRMESTSLRIKEGKFESVNERSAKLSASYDSEKIVVTACGKLKNLSFDEGCGYELKYIFRENTVEIFAISEKGGRFIIPVICSGKDEVVTEGKSAIIRRENAEIILESDSDISFDFKAPRRNFNVVGGFMTAPLYIDMKSGESVRFALTVK
ncbi:MAG: hypothetical protein J6M35_05675 [Clostridia bacterium]|nr:hypothetical protein [Clostridia bacterium]